MIPLVGFGLLIAAVLLMTKKASGAEYVDFTQPSSSGESSGPAAGAEVDIDAMIQAASFKYRVPAALVKAVAMTESSLNPNATNPSDPSYGLMAVMPILAEDFGIVKDWHNPTAAEIAMIREPQTNLNIGAWHLAYLTGKYELPVAIEMYNVGERGWNEGRRNSVYVSRVMKYYEQYRG